MKIVLYRPEIPQNTGNISRTCSALCADLMLIPPLGFYLHNKFLKRSGMDYMPVTDIEILEGCDLEWLENNIQNIWMFSGHGINRYDSVVYGSKPILLFGRESKGLPEEWLKKYPEKTLNIPMVSRKRSLNLSTSVGIAAYEVARQDSFAKII